MQTSGDKFQATLTSPGESLPKGLFTKELEVALLDGDAHLAVHSLKDLPTELPGGLALGAVLSGRMLGMFFFIGVKNGNADLN